VAKSFDLLQFRGKITVRCYEMKICPTSKNVKKNVCAKYLVEHRYEINNAVHLCNI